MTRVQLSIHEVPRKKPHGYYNLQDIHGDYEEVGDLILRSKTSWLFAEEISKIQKQAQSNNAAPKGSTRLFIYKVKQFDDHWMWNDAGGSKRKRGRDNKPGKKKNLSGCDGVHLISRRR